CQKFANRSGANAVYLPTSGEPGCRPPGRACSLLPRIHPWRQTRNQMAAPRLTISERMARIRKVDTKPELIVRRLLHSLGYRYRLHRTDLPGNPDIVFPSRRKVVFVHGCFWHQHNCKLGAKMPKARPEYWGPKLERNKT